MPRLLQKTGPHPKSFHLWDSPLRQIHFLGGSWAPKSEGFDLEVRSETRCRTGGWVEITENRVARPIFQLIPRLHLKYEVLPYFYWWEPLYCL